MTTIEGLTPVLIDVELERHRQESLKRQGKFSYSCADSEASDGYRLASLAEEFGEVSRHISDQYSFPEKRNPRELKKELIQVAAVAVAWCEAIDKELAGR